MVDLFSALCGSVKARDKEAAILTSCKTWLVLNASIYDFLEPSDYIEVDDELYQYPTLIDIIMFTWFIRYFQ